MSEIRKKDKRFIYRTKIKWDGVKKGLLSSPDKPDLKIATPPEFKGHAGIWTPEDLLVASVNSCIMTTFLYYAQREGLEFISYESEAEGVLGRVDNQLMFSEIKITPQLLIKQDSDIQKAEKIIELSEKNCLISNSIKSEVKVTPKISIQG